MRPRIEHALLAFASVLTLGACGDEPEPKPRGLLRLDLPEQAYTPWVDNEVLSTEIPAYATLKETRRSEGSRWYDLRFPGQRATVHITWSPVNGQLQAMIEDAHTFKDKHGAKASRIRSERILEDSVRVYGTFFDVDGDAASPLVFYLTDSTHNFLYGSLYFNARPSGDSLAPVSDRIREDMRHLARTLRWKKR